MQNLLKKLDLDLENTGTLGVANYTNEGKFLESLSPIDNALIAKISVTSKAQYESVVEEQQLVFKEWRKVPAPKRGEIVREIGNALRDYKKPLGELVTIEMGKILAEGEGEVQEAIDIADFAVGLSRQLYGKTMHSERVQHRMYEQWHPLGIPTHCCNHRVPGPNSYWKIERCNYSNNT